MGDSRIPPSTRARGQALSRASHDSHSHTSPITRREFLQGAGVAIASPLALARTPHAPPAHATPEQIHLTWGDDPSRAVFVSWASAAQALNPRVILQAAHGGPSVVRAAERRYTDGMNGQTVFTYHARLDGLHDDTAYSYQVTADNDARKADPFTA
ncbi:MAG: fibronectin type III domain-containing protein, partial [Gammaproteobacteria bacterium]|nr:fibronectin type III domain-containing protein [Gammaproteobacteria bacterium]